MLFEVWLSMVNQGWFTWRIGPNVSKYNIYFLVWTHIMIDSKWVYSTIIRKRMYMRAVVEENKPAIEFETLANLSALT